jgi:hypothetical protein
MAGNPFIDNNPFSEKNNPYLTGNPYRQAGLPSLTNNPYAQINNYKDRLSVAGQPVPERKPMGLGNLLMTTLDVLQRPQYMVTNTIDELINPNKYEGGVGKALLSGLTGERKTSTTDIFDTLGWQKDETKKWYQGGNLARNLLGFVGDVALDPTTYVSMGTSAFAKGIGTRAGKEAFEGVVKKGLIEGGEDLLTKSADDIAENIYTKLGKKVGENVNLDDINGLINKTGLTRDEAIKALEDATTARSRYMGQVMPGAGKNYGIKLENLGDDELKTLYGTLKDIRDYSSTGVKNADYVDATLRKLMPDADETLLIQGLLYCLAWLP